MVSNARLDLPEPDKPVTTIRLSRGISREMLRRLWTRAPCTAIVVRAVPREPAPRDPLPAVAFVVAAAVRAENGANVVSVVTTGADGKPLVMDQAVELGLRAGDQVEIRSGLGEGQQVLVK